MVSRGAAFSISFIVSGMLNPDKVNLGFLAVPVFPTRDEVVLMAIL